uniref:X protein n=1 Tax=Murray-Darling carp cultervirus TaxID=2830720 RepID=A0AA48SFL4_9MONO|nr:TPA_asm: X protein [Murray-Darling carp cultervirus]
MANKTVSTEAYTQALRRIIKHLEHVHIAGEESRSTETSQTESDTGSRAGKSPIRSTSNQGGVGKSSKEGGEVAEPTPPSLRVRSAAMSGGGRGGSGGSSE